MMDAALLGSRNAASPKFKDPFWATHYFGACHIGWACARFKSGAAKRFSTASPRPVFWSRPQKGGTGLQVGSAGNIKVLLRMQRSLLPALLVFKSPLRL